MIKYVASHQGYNILTSRSKSRSIRKDIPQVFQTMYQFLLLITTWFEEGLFFSFEYTFKKHWKSQRPGNNCLRVAQFEPCKTYILHEKIALKEKPGSAVRFLSYRQDSSVYHTWTYTGLNTQTDCTDLNTLKKNTNKMHGWVEGGSRLSNCHFLSRWANGSFGHKHTSQLGCFVCILLTTSRP